MARASAPRAQVCLTVRVRVVTPAIPSDRRGRVKRAGHASMGRAQSDNGEMPIKAITFDAYGTLLRNETLMLIPQRIVEDHKLSVSIHDVWHRWMALYFEATQVPHFRTLRVIQETILSGVLQSLDVRAAAD